MTNTEHDAGIEAAFSAYPDERMSRADIAEENAWWHWWWNEGRHQEVDPHQWPREAEPRLLDALRIAEAEVTCQGCGQRGKPSVCRHGKCICEDCYPDLCWGCQEETA